MDKSEAIERLEYLKAKAQVALEQEIPEWVANDILGTIEAYDMAIEALRKTENSSEKPNNCEDCKYWNDSEDGCADRHGCKTEPQTETSTNSEKVQLTDEPQTEEYEEPNYYDPALWE